MSVIPMARCVGSIRQISAGHGFCHFIILITGKLPVTRQSSEFFYDEASKANQQWHRYDTRI